MRVDRLFKNGWVYRTFRQNFERLDMAVTGETIVSVSPVLSCEADEVYDCTGMYLIPGMVDIHMHIDSSMTFPKEFSRIALPCGVTTVVADPHEIANVFGLEGILSFMEQETRMDIFYGIPSCVPATNPELETSGGSIGVEEVKQLLTDPRILCLGEVMNYQDLISKQDTMLKQIISVCRQDSRKIRMEGHIPFLCGEPCSRFAYAGIDADHTQQSPESVLEKTDLGIFLELQAKSLTPEVVKAVIEHNLYENIALVTDDTMPDDLVFDGQLDRIVRKAVHAGMPVEKAIYCSTFTPARRMRLDDRGMLAPGKLADFSILPDLSSFRPLAVFKNGAPCGAEERQDKQKVFPAHFYRSVILPPIHADRFQLKAEIENGSALVLVMQIQPFGTRTVAVKRKIPVRNGKLCWQEAGLNLACVWERHGRHGQCAYGLVERGLKSPGAIATTWAHDSHNLIVLGTSPADMAAACRHIESIQGGYTAVSEGNILATAHLPVGGIISDAPLEILAQEIKTLRAAIESLGYENNNVIMSISTLPLLVSPELKLSDRGLFLTETQEKQNLVLSWHPEETPE